MAKYCVLGIFVFATIMFSTFSVLSALQYKVGDSDGWHQPDDNNREMYETWAGNIDFHINDTILFVYKNDSAIEVSKPDYYHCNETSSTVAPKDGSTLFTLDKPGFYYFISGNLDHCNRGQRLMIEVPEPASNSKTNAANSVLSVMGFGMWCVHLMLFLI
ncbi:Early nodulin-like protein 1 [Rhynchospora pubera]|uniref:Early nodulin-like protein 1 n=1 Tax=Rhynchospora pubera TaxID=906938 RepID=A0AAV8DTV8_9POAL|nr:Early nodulin-like protein 1 [Rhynchospora pubera]